MPFPQDPTGQQDQESRELQACSCNESDGINVVQLDNDAGYQVRCTRCGCRGPVMVHRRDAVVNWNWLHTRKG